MAIATGTALALGGVAAAAGASAAGSIAGAHAQSNALTKASNIQKQYQQQLLDFQRMVYGEGAPFRDLAKGLLPDLRQQALSPESSAGYKLLSREGLDLLRGNAATTGDPYSGPSQIAQGRFQAGLAASERDAQIQRMFQLAGFSSQVGGQSTAQAANLLGAAGGPANNMANLAQSQGAVQGGLYGSLGNTFAQLPYAFMMANSFGGGGGASRAGGTFNPLYDQGLGSLPYNMPS